MRTVLISGLLAVAGVWQVIPVGRHWSEARLEGGAFWTRTKRGFWVAVLTLCLAYANLTVQFVPALMTAAGLEDVSFFLLLQQNSYFTVLFLLLPMLYGLLYRRTLRIWKEGVYAELDQVQWDTAYTRTWGNAAYRSHAAHTGFFGFLKRNMETGKGAPDDIDRRPDDVRIAGRPWPLQPTNFAQASGQYSTIHPWHSYRYHLSGRYLGGRSFRHAPSSPGNTSGRGGFQGMGGQGRGTGAGRSFVTSSGGSFHSGGRSKLAPGLVRSASGGGGFRSGGGTTRGGGAGRSFSESSGFSDAVRAGALYNAGTRSSSPKLSGGKSGPSGKKGKGKGGGGAAGIGAAMLAALRVMLMFLLAVALVAVVLFAGYGTVWLVVNHQDGKHNFFRELEQMTLLHAGKDSTR